MGVGVEFVLCGPKGSIPGVVVPSPGSDMVRLPECKSGHWTGTRDGGGGGRDLDRTTTDTESVGIPQPPSLEWEPLTGDLKWDLDEETRGTEGR